MAIVGCKVDGVFQPVSGDGRWTSKAEGEKEEKVENREWAQRDASFQRRNRGQRSVV
jgi:hypothetical protein